MKNAEKKKRESPKKLVFKEIERFMCHMPKERGLSKPINFSLRGNF